MESQSTQRMGQYEVRVGFAPRRPKPRPGMTGGSTRSPPGCSIAGRLNAGRKSMVALAVAG